MTTWPSQLVLNTPLYYTGPWDLHATSTPTIKKYHHMQNHGMEFHDTNNTTVLKVNETGLGGQGSPPTTFSITRATPGQPPVTIVTSGLTSAVVQDGDTIDCYDGSTWIMGFDIDMTGTNQLIFPIGQSGNSGNQPAQPSVDPIIQNVVYTKTDDDSVTLTFDWDENNGPFNQYSIFRLRPNTVLYNNSIGVSGTSGAESRTETIAPLLGGLEDGDKLYIENSQAPLHIVSGFGSINLPYTHKLIDFSIGYVSGSKVVIAKFFGSSPTPLPNTSPTFDGRFVDNEGGSVDWSYSGNLLSINLPYKRGRIYQVKIRQVGSSTDVEDYGSSYRLPIGKVFCNFW